MAAADQSSKAHKTLATQEPTIHGFRSGLWGGRKSIQVPTAFSAAAAVGLLWDDILSRSEAPNATGPSERAEHLAGLQSRRQPGLEAKIEQLAVHRTIDDPSGIQPVMAQGRDECLGFPVAEGRIVDQARGWARS